MKSLTSPKRQENFGKLLKKIENPKVLKSYALKISDISGKTR